MGLGSLYKLIATPERKDLIQTDALFTPCLATLCTASRDGVGGGVRREGGVVRRCTYLVLGFSPLPAVFDVT